MVEIWRNKPEQLQKLWYSAPLQKILLHWADTAYQKVHHVSSAALDHFDAQVFANVIAKVVEETKATVVVFSHNQTGKAVAPGVAAAVKAGIVTGAVALPDINNGFVVKKSVFSGKAFANVNISSEIKIISLNPNSYKTVAGKGMAEVIELNVPVPESK